MMVSVIVLTKNRPEYIKKCLDSIFMQEYNIYEIIVVDSNSNKQTKKLLNSYLEYSNIQIHDIGNCTIGRARQIGVRIAKGDIIAYIDSDVELPHKNWIKHMIIPFQNKSIAGVQTLAKTKESDPEILKKVHSSFEYKNELIDIDHYEPIGTSHLLIRKDLIDLVGGFKDISFKEDTDLTYRIMELGYKFVYLKNEKCYHYYVKNYNEYLKKEIRNKYNGLICKLRGIK